MPYADPEAVTTASAIGATSATPCVSPDNEMVFPHLHPIPGDTGVISGAGTTDLLNLDVVLGVSGRTLAIRSK